jgi:hypothetical protein
MDPANKEHPLLIQLSEDAQFYKDLATSVMGWVTQGTMGSVLNIDTMFILQCTELWTRLKIF